MVRNLTSGDQSNHRHARYEATSRGHPRITVVTSATLTTTTPHIEYHRAAHKGGPWTISMTTTETSRAKYEIAYDKTRQSVIVYPQFRGTRPNHHVIGEFQPDSAHDEFDSYRIDLGEAVRDALARVGELDVDAWGIHVTPLDGTPAFQAKEPQEPLKRVPKEDQVAVGSGRTAAEAAVEEHENGEGIPHASQATREMQKDGLAEATPAKLDESVPHSGGTDKSEKPAKGKKADKE